MNDYLSVCECRLSFVYLLTLFIHPCSAVQIQAKSFYQLPVTYSMVSEFEEEPLVFRIDRDSGKVYPLEELRYIRDKRRYTMIVTAHEQNSNKETKTKVRETPSCEATGFLTRCVQIYLLLYYNV